MKPGYKQTEVGEIPEDWEDVLLGDYAVKVGSGITPRGGSTVYKAEGRPFVRSQNIGWGSLKLSDLAFIDENTHQTFSATEIQKDDVLLNITGASIGRCSVASEDLSGGNVNQHVCIIRTNSGLDQKYLSYVLLSSIGQNQIDSFQAGGNREGLNFGQIRSFLIPKSKDVGEQKAIAKALSDVDDLIASLEKLIAKKLDFKTATMEQLLTGKKRLPGFGEGKGYKKTELGKIPEDWEVSKLGSIGEFKNGINKEAKDFGHGDPFVNLMDVFGVPLIYDATKLTLINSNETEKRIYNLIEGDVVFIRSSVKPSGVGLTTVIYSDLPNTVFSGFLIRFRDNGSLEKEYKKYCFHEANLRNRVIAASTVSANTNINQDGLKELRIVLPKDKNEQKEIATILSRIDSEIDAIEYRLNKTKAIKQGMMQELLTGRTRLVEPQVSSAEEERLHGT